MRDAAGQAFEDLYARHYGRLLGFARWAYGAADADDIAQDAMVRAYASFAGLDPDRDPWPWLVAIARNVARDRYARDRALPLADVPLTTPDATAAVEERAVVDAALRRLSRADRDVLLLREWHELSFDELSRLLGRSPNTVRQQVFRARRRLAAAYTEVGGRAVGIACWVRWRLGGPAAAQVAAAVVTGALVAGVPAGPAERVPDRPRVAAGPAVHGGTPAGPTARGARPQRPLLPPRVAPPSVAAAEEPRRPRPERPPAPAAAPAPAPRPSVRVETDRAGHEGAGGAVGGDGALCAVTALCDRGR